MYALLRIVESGVTPITFQSVPFSFRRLYAAVPFASKGTAPMKMESPHGIVSSMIVEPASVPTPTVSCSCASGPRPEKSMIAPSGTAPRMGSTTEPTMPEMEGTRSSSSEPSDSMLLALNRMRP